MVEITPILSVLFFAGAVIGGLIIMAGGTWFYMQKKKYGQYNIVFFEKDGFGQWVKGFDNAGIFVDSHTQNKRLFLEKMKVGLDANAVPYITDNKGKKTVYLIRYGLKNFRFLHMNFNTPDTPFQVGEEDVNWAINSYDRAKKRFVDTMLMQMMPYIGLFFTGVIILIIFLYFFKQISVLADVARSFEHAAEVFASKGGTVVI